MLKYVFILLLASTALAQSDGTRLQLLTKALPAGTTGHTYNAGFKARGQGPFQWAIEKGKLPPGIRLQENTGALTGVPTLSGAYTFTVRVLDESSRAVLRQPFTLEIKGALLLEWVKQPSLAENTISGSIKVTNNSTAAENFDLTVIVVAVNEVGKAFALGYQHFPLSQDVEQDIPFTQTVPNGSYIVHVDAIAEVAATKSIYRSRLQTQSPLVVSVNR
jgi:hypothetical protein